MKIKIIDLLNKIANKEEMPEKIKFNAVIWKYKKETQDYYSVITNEPLLNDYSSLGIWIMKHLNAEVEIIEEDKPIEELEIIENEIDKQVSLKVGEHLNTIRKIDVVFATKINELIKEIKKMKEEKNE